MLFRTALTYVSHTEDAQDIVHDVFAAYLAKRPSFQDGSHERAWMLRVTINKCRDLQRRNAVRRYIPLEDAEHLTAADDPAAFEPVSYTHLDVYKRQPPRRRNGPPPMPLRI